MFFERFLVCFRGVSDLAGGGLACLTEREGEAGDAVEEGVVDEETGVGSDSEEDTRVMIWERDFGGDPEDSDSEGGVTEEDAVPRNEILLLRGGGAGGLDNFRGDFGSVSGEAAW